MSMVKHWKRDFHTWR